MIFAAQEKQRRPVKSDETVHPTDENQMIAAGVLRFVAAFEPGAAAGQERRVAGARGERQAGELVRPRCGKALRQFLLILRQYVDRVVAAIPQQQQRWRVERETP